MIVVEGAPDDVRKSLAQLVSRPEADSRRRRGLRLGRSFDLETLGSVATYYLQSPRGPQPSQVATPDAAVNLSDDLRTAKDEKQADSNFAYKKKEVESRSDLPGAGAGLRGSRTMSKTRTLSAQTSHRFGNLNSRIAYRLRRNRQLHSPQFRQRSPETGRQQAVVYFLFRFQAGSDAASEAQEASQDE